MSNWRPIAKAPRGLGPLLLRCGSGALDPVFIGHQDDDGRWFFGELEVEPVAYCEIPAFDCEETGA